jgi:hypothetical protein
MIQYEGMKAEESRGESYEQLPVGAYIGVCLDAKIEGVPPQQFLKLALDVDDPNSPYNGYYAKRLAHDQQSGSKYEVKFKGTFSLRVPYQQNQYPETDMRRMNDMIAKFENSNLGFHFDGQELKLKGLKIGFSTQEDEYNGSTFTRIGRLENVDDVQAGTVNPMPKRKRNENQNSASAAMPLPPSQTPVDPVSGMPVVNTVELPF